MAKTKDDIQNLVLPLIRDEKRAGVILSMGIGKTLLCLKDMDYHYSETSDVLVVAPQLTVFKSWKDDLRNFDMEYLLDHITFSTYLSLTKQRLNYDTVYLDEMHSLIPEEHDSWLSQFTGRIIGVTGTEPKSWTDRGKFINKYCPVVYRYDTDDAVEDDILNDYRIIVHAMPLDSSKTLQMTSKAGKSWMTSELESYHYWCKRLDMTTAPAEEKMMRLMRMKALQGFPSKEVYAKQLLYDTDDKCVIFANTQKQADRLYPSSYHSGNSRSEENMKLFEEGTIKKLSCVHQLSQGANIKGLKVVIILHSYGNNIKTPQRLGRALRLPPGEKATIHILTYRNTVDIEWTRSALSGFDQSKITWTEVN